MHLLECFSSVASTQFILIVYWNEKMPNTWFKFYFIGYYIKKSQEKMKIPNCKNNDSLKLIEWLFQEKYHTSFSSTFFSFTLNLIVFFKCATFLKNHCSNVHRLQLIFSDYPQPLKLNSFKPMSLRFICGISIEKCIPFYFIVFKFSYPNRRSQFHGYSVANVYSAMLSKLFINLSYF